MDNKEKWQEFFDEGMAAAMDEDEARRYADEKLADWYGDKTDAYELQFEDR